MKDGMLIWLWCSICLAFLMFAFIDGDLRQRLDELQARMDAAAAVVR